LNVLAAAAAAVLLAMQMVPEVEVEAVLFRG
jgi:hypothetical protein